MRIIEEIDQNRGETDGKADDGADEDQFLDLFFERSFDFFDRSESAADLTVSGAGADSGDLDEGRAAGDVAAGVAEIELEMAGGIVVKLLVDHGGFAGEGRFVDTETLELEDLAVGGDFVAFFEEDEVANY